MMERVADADRDRTVATLREHVVAGRLTLDEFSERMGTALQARTRGDLEAVMADLPAAARPEGPPVVVGTPRKVRRWHVAIMSGHSTKGRWRISGKTNAVAIMGGCDLDLRRAEIDGSEVEITAFAFWGGVEIIVPEGFDVELRGFSFMGGRSLRLRDVPIVPGSPRIVVRGFALMGGIEVKSRHSRPSRQLARPAAADASGALTEPGAARALARDIRRELRQQRANSRRGVESSPPDGTVTILFCDMVDYAGMTERIGDQASHRVLREHHRIVREALSQHGGREISVQGDGFMVAFAGVARALRCAVDIQRAFRDYVPTDGDEPIAVHIGVNTGDAVADGDDYLGTTVIVASRLADAAAPGEILVSSLSEQLVVGSGEFTFDGHRDTALKGMVRPQPSATLLWA
jgi:class 3 adenylate cyclase